MLLIIVRAEKRRERKMTKGRGGGIFSIKLEMCNYSLKHFFFFNEFNSHKRVNSVEQSCFRNSELIRELILSASKRHSDRKTGSR